MARNQVRLDIERREPSPVAALSAPPGLTSTRSAKCTGREVTKFGVGFALTAQADPVALRDLAAGRRAGRTSVVGGNGAPTRVDRRDGRDD
jgi:hypothetical protein